LIGNGRTIFFNSDNKILTDLLKDHQVNSVSYGLSDKHCQGEIIAPGPYLKMEFTFQLTSKPLKIQVNSNLVGQYNAENIMAAVCVGLYFKIQPEEIKKAIEHYVPTNNRSQLVNTKKNRLLLDYYNANPSSTEAAVKNFLTLEGSNKVFILGDMLELGDESKTEHENILKILACINDCQILLVGKYYKELAPAFGFLVFSNAEELRDWLAKNPIEQSFILIKGSRGMQLEKIVEKL
jgi:UDP-N-acetylmuramoyl-tripeptide--D-alanyl-D-alanine ligase